jgi:hypothetical protein
LPHRQSNAEPFIVAHASAGLTLFAVASSLLAQRGPTAPTAAESKTKSAAKPKAQAEAPPLRAPQVVMPDTDKIVLLVRTTLLTLNDALQTRTTR